MNIVKYEYRGMRVVIGKSPNYNLWRASIDGKQIAAFFATQYTADTHCKSIIDARGTHWNAIEASNLGAVV